MARPAFLVVASLIALSSSSRGQGGPPLLTDDPGTPGDGVWEFNVAATWIGNSSATLWEAPLLDLNYGIGERTQLKLEVPWITLDEDGQETESGLGNGAFGVKWRFLDEEESGFSVSTYPQLEFVTSSSSEREGLVDEGAEVLLPFQVERHFGVVGVGGEVGYATREGGEDGWIWGLCVGGDVAEGFELLAEVHGDEDIVGNIGFRCRIGEHETVLLSSGHGLRDTDETDWTAYVGVQFFF